MKPIETVPSLDICIISTPLGNSWRASKWSDVLAVLPKDMQLKADRVYEATAYHGIYCPTIELIEGSIIFRWAQDDRKLSIWVIAKVDSIRFSMENNSIEYLENSRGVLRQAGKIWSDYLYPKGWNGYATDCEAGESK